MYVRVPSLSCRVEVDGGEKSLVKHPGKKVSWVSPGPARSPPRARFQCNGHRFTSVMGKPMLRVGLLAWATSCGGLGCAVAADKREVPDVD